MTTIEASDAPLSDWTPRQVITGTLVVLSVVIGFLLAYRFRLVAIIVFSGIVVSIAMTPAVDWLQRHRLPRALSVIVIYLVLLIMLIGFIVLLVPPIVEQPSTALPKIESYRDLKSALATSPSLLIRQIAIRLPPQINLTLAASSATDDALDAVSQVFATTGAVITGLLPLTAMLLIGFYWTQQGEGALRTLLRPLANNRRESAQADPDPVEDALEAIALELNQTLAPVELSARSA